MPKYASTMPYAPAQSISPDDSMSSTARLSHERPHTGSVTAPSPSVASYGYRRMRAIPEAPFTRTGTAMSALATARPSLSQSSAGRHQPEPAPWAHARAALRGP